MDIVQKIFSKLCIKSTDEIKLKFDNNIVTLTILESRCSKDVKEIEKKLTEDLFHSSQILEVKFLTNGIIRVKFTLNPFEGLFNTPMISSRQLAEQIYAKHFSNQYQHLDEVDPEQFKKIATDEIWKRATYIELKYMHHLKFGDPSPCEQCNSTKNLKGCDYYTIDHGYIFCDDCLGIDNIVKNVLDSCLLVNDLANDYPDDNSELSDFNFFLENYDEN